VNYPKKIESSANPQIRNFKKIVSGKSKDYWIIEGKNLFFEAVASGIILEQIFITPDTWKKESRRLSGLNAPIFIVASSLMKMLTTVETPPGIIAVARRLAPPSKEPSGEILVFVHALRDPGNLGALIRSAEAAGCAFVACSPDTSDPYSPKVVRASMGSIFRIPVFKVPDTLDYLNKKKASGIRISALTPHDGKNLFELKASTPMMLIVGGETSGLPAGFEPDELLTIPMNEKVESLNAGVAASIAMFVLKNSAR
jgi:TrmH family RNA methyltransferase